MGHTFLKNTQTPARLWTEVWVHNNSEGTELMRRRETAWYCLGTVKIRVTSLNAARFSVVQWRRIASRSCSVIISWITRFSTVSARWILTGERNSPRPCCALTCYRGSIFDECCRGVDSSIRSTAVPGNIALRASVLWTDVLSHRITVFHHKGTAPSIHQCKPGAYIFIYHNKQAQHFKQLKDLTALPRFNVEKDHNKQWEERGRMKGRMRNHDEIILYTSAVTSFYYKCFI